MMGPTCYEIAIRILMVSPYQSGSVCMHLSVCVYMRSRVHVCVCVCMCVCVPVINEFLICCAVF